MQHKSDQLDESFLRTSTGDIYQIKLRLSIRDFVDRALVDPDKYLCFCINN